MRNARKQWSEIRISTPNKDKLSLHLNGPQSPGKRGCRKVEASRVALRQLHHLENDVAHCHYSPPKNWCMDFMNPRSVTIRLR